MQNRKYITAENMPYADRELANGFKAKKSSLCYA